MDSPLAQHSSPRRKRFGHKPGQAGTAASPLAWLQRHPLAAAAVYMLIGGCLGEQYRCCSAGCAVGRAAAAPLARLAVSSAISNLSLCCQAE